jgi:hypothetical protein
MHQIVYRDKVLEGGRLSRQCAFGQCDGDIPQTRIAGRHGEGIVNPTALTNRGGLPEVPDAAAGGFPPVGTKIVAGLEEGNRRRVHVRRGPAEDIVPDDESNL